MNDIMMRLVDAPIARMFILAGIIFLMIAVLGRIEGKIEPGRIGRIGAVVLGIAMLFLGVFMQSSETHELRPEQLALLQQMLMANTPAPAQPATALPGKPIKIVSATYGRSCNAKIGNANTALAKECDGKTSCDYAPDPTLEDPAPNCNKDLAAEWKCGNGSSIYAATLPADAVKGEKLHLACAP